jgi:hypothetical protein
LTAVSHKEQVKRLEAGIRQLISRKGAFERPQHDRERTSSIFGIRGVKTLSAQLRALALIQTLV